MKYTVVITDTAVGDLEDMDRFIEEREGPERADLIIRTVIDAINKLDRSPHRGTIPRELEIVGEEECREIFVEPWRILYSVAGGQVKVHIVADMRRDIRSVYERWQMRR